MKRFIIMEHEVNMIADLLNECKDKDGALLRPSKTTFDKVWNALDDVVKRETKQGR